jgi:ribosomal protein S4
MKEFNSVSDNMSDEDIVECKAQFLVDMVIMCKFAKSKTQARQLIKSGAIRIQDMKITNTNALIAWNKERDELYVIYDHDKK